MTDDTFAVGTTVSVDLTGARFVRCPECGYGWMIAGHNNATCPECGEQGIIGTAVDFEKPDTNLS